MRVIRRGIIAATLFSLLCLTGPGIGAGTTGADAAGSPYAGKIAVPAVGEALAHRVAVRTRPRTSSPVRAVMKAFRFDFRPTVFFAIQRRETKRGEWYKVRIPGRPNGRTGWVSAAVVRLVRPAGPFRIVVDRSERRLSLHRGKRLVMKAAVAVGTPDAPTPLGRFYVTAGFRPADDFLGPWAFETSAYAAISDWPRGGIVGLHGTSEPASVGRRASHGCIRVYNKVILTLRERVRPGTPIRIRA